MRMERCTAGHPAATGPESLSHREIEVLSQVSEGRSNRDVAESLGLSSLTVKSHLARIARKLGTGDRAEMVVMALRAGLIN
jgi:DNA-binding NarL/FixJ family response regulator